MANIAERYADQYIVTDDNPRGEDGDAIVSQIVAGFESADNVVVERDRRAAIRKAMINAGAGDIVVIAGKGHEDYQLIGDQKLPFSDNEVVSEYVLELAS
jgi:UDP-N-acetylmuramoyl-L-alanyl-D-glutamate--2,6-diaminopimelate ligase